jgi:hypothetical protein
VAQRNAISEATPKFLEPKIPNQAARLNSEEMIHNLGISFIFIFFQI